MDYTLKENMLGDIWGGMKKTWQQNKQAVQNAWQTGKSNFQAGYQQGKQSVDQNYEKYAQQAQNALAKVKNIAQVMSKKTGVSLPLATAMLAAGVTGGASAIPVAALTYFARKPVTALASKGFDVAWDAGKKIMQKQPAQQLQPEHFSFKEWLELQEAGVNMASAAQFAGRMAGKAAGYGQNIGSSIKNRAQEIAQSITKNPKEAAKLAFLVGVGAATGGVLGNLSRQAVDQITQSVQDYVQGVPAEEVAWLRNNIVLEPTGDGGFSSEGEQMLQQGNNSYENVPMEPPPGEGNTIVAGNSFKDTETLGSPGSSADYAARKSSMTDALTDTHSGGKMGYFNTVQGHSKSLEDAYRDAAKQLGSLSSQTSTGPWNPLLGKTTGLMPALRDMNVNPEEMIAKYGHSAAQEIKNRLASPDNMTIPGAIGGAAGAYQGRRR